MKGTTKILGIIAAALVIFATGCASPYDTPSTSNGIDYKNYIDGNYSIKVKNDSTNNVVCFKNTPSATTLISGAKAGCITGLKKDPALFSGSNDFVLFVVTEKDYLQYKGNWEELKNRPLCRLLAYYNENAESNNNLVYTISEKLGGEYFFQLNNITKYNCEIRLDGLYGEPFCYAGAETINTKVYAEAGDYNFYPVFRKFDKNSGTIITAYPKTAKGNPERITIGLGPKTEAALINCSDYIGSTSIKIAPSATYIKINNQSATGIKLFQGANAVASVTDTGFSIINTGKDATFTINLDPLGEGQYETSKKISGWKVGPEGATIDIPEITLEAGYRYVLTVTGPSYDDLSCSFDVDKDSEIIKYPVDLEEEK